jgi:transposase
LHTVHLACTLPDQAGRAVSHWDSTELARQLVADGVVPAISPPTVQRILARFDLKPWRTHTWLHPRTPRDAAFVQTVQNLADLYTRLLAPTELVLCVDELTSVQPRPRRALTRPAQPHRPRQIEQEYQRAGALQIFAAFDTRTGEVTAGLFRRKRQAEFLQFLAHLDALTPATITTIHLVCDNVSVHHGRLTRAWLADHPRFVLHFTPVHCSWMNQVEQWFGILTRKRLRHPDFPHLGPLADAITAFIALWNTTAHPFRWTTSSFDKVLHKAEATLALPVLPQASA